jgi:hypothetical protein
MDNQIFNTFDSRAMLVRRYLSGVKLDSLAPPQRIQEQQSVQQQMQQHHQARQQSQQMLNGSFQPQQIMQNSMNGMGQNADMDIFVGSGMGGNMNMGHSLGNAGFNDGEMPLRAQRNPSIISFGGGRAMSFASDQSYGRAMSGLSALSIDWENMDDFDINVDHSAHINNGMNLNAPMGGNDGNLDPKPIGGGGGRRSSLRQPFIVNGNDNDAHVSFKV